MTTSQAAQPDTSESGLWPSPAKAWWAVFVLMTAYALGFLDRIVVSLLVQPIERDLGLNDAQMGMLQGFAFAISYTALGLPAGWLADRWSRRNLIAAGVFVWSAATAACGFARNYTELFAARVFVGAGEATLGPSASSLIADLFPPEKRAQPYGVYVMGTALASGIGMFLVGQTIGWLDGAEAAGTPIFPGFKTWELVFIIVGLPGLLVGLLMFSFAEPKRKGRLTKDASIPIREVVRFLLNEKALFAALILGMTVTISSVYASIAWTPSFFVRYWQWEPSTVAKAMGLTSAPAGIISAITAGMVTTWIATKRGRVDAPVITCLTGAIGASIPMVAMVFMPTPELALAANFLGSCFVNWPTANIYAAINRVTPNEMRGQLTAVYTLVVGLLAVGFGPLSVGLMTDHLFADKTMVGYSIALFYAFCGTVSAVLLAFALPRFRRAAERAKAWEGA